MKLRLLPILITFILTFSLLFGGWFVYRSVAVENPLAQAVSSIDGVQLKDIKITASRVVIRLNAEQDISLREVYRQVAENGEQTIGKRQLDIQIVNPSSAKLDQIWSAALFDVAQAMETKHYAQIPKTMDRLMQEHAGLTAVTEMDDSNVYVRLQDGDSSKYIILPRMPATIGVWPNEQIQ